MRDSDPRGTPATNLMRGVLVSVPETDSREGGMKGAAAGLSGMVALALLLPMEAGVPIPGLAGLTGAGPGQRGSQMTTGMSRSVRR